MPADILADTRGLLALLALLLLPGLVVVRAPWTAVPFLSLSFWMTTWWWLAPTGAGRRRFLVAALVLFVLLAGLRLLRARPVAPGVVTTLVLAAALLRLLPFFLWPAAPGAEASFHGLATLLMAVRDGVPESYEPLLPVRGFGAYPPGLHGFGADLALLGRIPAYRAAFLATLAGQVLLQIALFGLLGRFLSRSTAAVAAVLALTAARLPSALAIWGEGSAVLALAFVLAAAALVRSDGRPAAVATGAFLGAALVCQPQLALIGALVLAAGALRGPGLLIAVAVALVWSGPFLVRLDLPLSTLDLPLSTREAAGWVEDVGRGGFAVSAVSALLVLAIARFAERIVGSRHPAARLALAILVAAAFEGWRRDASRRPEVPITRDDLAAMAWIATHTRPTAVFCNDSRTAAVWIPAVAGRAVRAPVVPFMFRDEIQSAGPRPCAYRYQARGGSGEAPPSPEMVVFENATVIVTSFDSPRGNTGTAGPVGPL